MNINEIKHPKLMGLSKITLRQFPFGHVQTMTYGPKRIGKTIYYILAMMDMYHVIFPDMTREERFKKAMDNTIFTISDFIKKIKKLQRLLKKFRSVSGVAKTQDLMIAKGIPELAIHIDDAGVGFNKYKYFSDRGEVEELKSIIDTVGTVVTGLYLSSPTLKGVLGFLQEYEGYRIHVIRRNSLFARTAKIYKLIELPSGTMRVQTPKKDSFNCWLPSELYNIYRIKRAKYLDISINKLEEYQKFKGKNKYVDKDLKRTIAVTRTTLAQMKEDGII